MTAREVLAKVLRAGGRVIADPARPRLVVPPSLKPLVLEHREALRALVLSGEVPTEAPPPPRVRAGAYSYPWPDALPELGSRHVGPFELCADAPRRDCERYSCMRYGRTVLCVRCALRRAQTALA